VVRAVNVGLACGLIGGVMLIPLGQTFSEQVLHEGPGGFGVFVFALGVGTAAGVVGVSALQARLHKARTFVLSLFCAGVALIVGVSMSTLMLSAMWVAIMGIFAGSVYVLGFTLLHENVEDELRGRIFSAPYTLVRSACCWPWHWRRCWRTCSTACPTGWSAARSTWASRSRCPAYDPRCGWPASSCWWRVPCPRRPSAGCARGRRWA
jgi:hypothetical protein